MIRIENNTLRRGGERDRNAVPVPCRHRHGELVRDRVRDTVLKRDRVPLCPGNDLIQRTVFHRKSRRRARDRKSRCEIISHNVAPLIRFRPEREAEILCRRAGDHRHGIIRAEICSHGVCSSGGKSRHAAVAVFHAVQLDIIIPRDRSGILSGVLRVFLLPRELRKSVRIIPCRIDPPCQCPKHYKDQHDEKKFPAAVLCHLSTSRLFVWSGTSGARYTFLVLYNNVGFIQRHR